MVSLVRALSYHTFPGVKFERWLDGIEPGVPAAAPAVSQVVQCHTNSRHVASCVMIPVEGTRLVGTSQDG